MKHFIFNYCWKSNFIWRLLNLWCLKKIVIINTFRMNKKNWREINSKQSERGTVIKFYLKDMKYKESFNQKSNLNHCMHWVHDCSATSNFCFSRDLYTIFPFTVSIKSYILSFIGCHNKISHLFLIASRVKLIIFSLDRSLIVEFNHSVFNHDYVSFSFTTFHPFLFLL